MNKMSIQGRREQEKMPIHRTINGFPVFRAITRISSSSRYQTGLLNTNQPVPDPVKYHVSVYLVSAPFWNPWGATLWPREVLFLGVVTGDEFREEQMCVGFIFK